MLRDDGSILEALQPSQSLVTIQNTWSLVGSPEKTILCCLCCFFHWRKKKGWTTHRRLGMTTKRPNFDPISRCVRCPYWTSHSVSTCFDPMFSWHLHRATRQTVKPPTKYTGRTSLHRTWLDKSIYGCDDGACIPACGGSSPYGCTNDTYQSEHTSLKMRTKPKSDCPKNGAPRSTC